MIIHVHVANKEAEDQRGGLAKLMEPSIIYTKGSIYPEPLFRILCVQIFLGRGGMWQVSETDGSTNHAQVM